MFDREKMEAIHTLPVKLMRGFGSSLSTASLLPRRSPSVLCCSGSGAHHSVWCVVCLASAVCAVVGSLCARVHVCVLCVRACVRVCVSGCSVLCGWQVKSKKGRIARSRSLQTSAAQAENVLTGNRSRMLLFTVQCVFGWLCAQATSAVRSVRHAVPAKDQAALGGKHTYMVPKLPWLARLTRPRATTPTPTP